MENIETTFNDLVKIEPMLGELLNKIKSEKPTTCMEECWWTRWYGGNGNNSYKQDMLELVGWLARVDNPILRSNTAYEIAYNVLSESLPDCKVCQYDGCEDSQRYRPQKEC